jgi:hypothetical protein
MKRCRETKIRCFTAVALSAGTLLLLFAGPGCKDARTPRQNAQASTNVPATSPAAEFKQGGQKMAEGAQDIGHAVQNTAVRTWDTVKTGAVKAGGEIKKGAEKTGETIKDTAQKIGDKFKSDQ